VANNDDLVKLGKEIRNESQTGYKYNKHGVTSLLISSVHLSNCQQDNVM